jgi:hypothetical protein
VGRLADLAATVEDLLALGSLSRSLRRDLKLSCPGWVQKEMRLKRLFAFACLPGLLIAAGAQQPAGSIAGPVAGSGTASATAPVALDWTPPELAALGARAEVKNSFVLDRTMLGAASALLPDSDADARQSIRKLDGIAVHIYRFHDYDQIDPQQVELIRQAYHVRGWKHLVTSASTGAPVHGGTDRTTDRTTDLWLMVDGVSVRGGTLLEVTPRSVNLVTFAGDLNPIDLLRLRGHFGIPNFNGDKFQDAR